MNGNEAGRSTRAGFGTCGVVVSPTSPPPRPLLAPLPRRWRGGRVRAIGARGASTADMMLGLMLEIVFDSEAVANVVKKLLRSSRSILSEVLSVNRSEVYLSKSGL
jgi:hypothetical protein